MLVKYQECLKTHLLCVNGCVCVCVLYVYACIFIHMSVYVYVCVYMYVCKYGVYVHIYEEGGSDTKILFPNWFLICQ